MSRLISLTISVLLFSVVGLAQVASNPSAVPNKQLEAIKPSSGDEPQFVMCKNKDIVRTMRVIKKSNGGCSTVYTKEGVDDQVAESWSVERCEKVLSNIQENLEKAGWKCKSISESRVSMTQE